MKILEEVQRYLAEAQEQLEKLSPEDQERIERLITSVRQLPPDARNALELFVADLVARCAYPSQATRYEVPVSD